MLQKPSRYACFAGLVALVALVTAAATGATAADAARAPEPALALTATLSERKLTVTRGSEVVKMYDIAIGSDKHPTPTGAFMIRKIVWNPSWVPPDAKWAQGRKPQDPGHPDNPMKLVKLFFQEPDYYIHGTGAVESLGQAASHGCLRMDPNDAGELALMVMENGGVSRDWDWVMGVLHLGETRAVSLQRPALLNITP